MKAKIFSGEKFLSTDFSEPIDISLCISRGLQVSAFYIEPATIHPLRIENFVGSVAEGGSCNCEVITIAPHGNGTHTECVGHISKEKISINKCLKKFFFEAELITITPTHLDNGDRVISRELLEKKNLPSKTDALIIRTMPNSEEKKTFSYSGTNPTYFTPDAMDFIRERNVSHLLTDLPSVDREEDGGLLQAHHRFWNYPDNPRYDATITELIFVPDEIPDGKYFLHFQIISIESDASPSKPVLYRITEE